MKVMNDHLGTFILTSKRLVLFKFGGLFGKKSDSVNFENLNDCMHVQSGILDSKIANSGSLILNLASGEERKIRHIPHPGSAVSIIAQIQELYISEGRSASFAYLFSVNNALRHTKKKLVNTLANPVAS